MPAPLDVGVAPHGAQPRTRGIDEHAIEGGCEGKRTLGGHVDRVRMLAASLTNGVAKQGDTPCSHVARDEHAAVAHVAAHHDGLSAGCGAQVERALTGLGVDGERHELRRFVLHEKPIVARLAKRVSLRRREARAERVRVSSHSIPSAASALRTSSRVARSRLTLSVRGAGSLLNCTHFSACSNPTRSSHRATSHSGCDQVTPR